MTIWVISDRPDHPVLAEVTTSLAAEFATAAIDPTDPAAVARARIALWSAPPRLVLLKSHDEVALELAFAAHRLGSIVINPPAATAAALDRGEMAAVARQHDLPFPLTSKPFRLDPTDPGWVGPPGSHGRPDAVVAALAELGGPGEHPVRRGPGAEVLVKSRRSRRGDLVTRVRADELAALARDWPGEEVVLQPVVEFDGWDHKVWVIGAEVFAVRRPTPVPHLGAAVSPVPASVQRDVPIELPAAWADLVARVGMAYELSVFGVDLLATPAGPLIVDVNPFPGSRGGVGAAAAIVALALQACAATAER